MLYSRQFSYKIPLYEHGDGIGRSWEIYRWHLSVGHQKSESNRILGVTILKSRPGVFWICPYSWMPTLCPNSGSVLSPRTRTVYFVFSATISEFNGNLLGFFTYRTQCLYDLPPLFLSCCLCVRTSLWFHPLIVAVSVRFVSSFSKLPSLRAYKSPVSPLIVAMSVRFASSFF